MISSEVQRTLVKSPPELWAELSDPTALSRHLGELGEIRITRVDPEQAVEWQAGDISGTVLIKPSGWGTKVTLTVNGELDLQEPPAAPPAPAADPHPPTEAEPQGAAENPSEPPFDASEPESSTAPWPTSLPDEAELTEEASPDPIEGEQEAPPPAWPAEVGFQWEAESDTDRSEPELNLATRRGWLSRLFGRRRKTEIVDHERAEALEVLERQAELPEAAASWEQTLEPPTAGVNLGSPAELQEPPELQEPQEPPKPAELQEPPKPREPPERPGHEAIEASASSAPQDSAEPEPADMATELRAAEEVTAEQVTAVLTAVLDRLGAAHHRPFSRG